MFLNNVADSAVYSAGLYNCEKKICVRFRHVSCSTCTYTKTTRLYYSLSFAGFNGNQSQIFAATNIAHKNVHLYNVNTISAQTVLVGDFPISAGSPNSEWMVRARRMCAVTHVLSILSQWLFNVVGMGGSVGSNCDSL